MMKNIIVHILTSLVLALAMGFMVSGCFDDKPTTGVVGEPGKPGADGTNGTNGTDGADGKDGDPGALCTQTATVVAGQEDCSLTSCEGWQTPVVTCGGSCEWQTKVVATSSTGQSEPYICWVLLCEGDPKPQGMVCDGMDGPVGPRGPMGETGITGPAGPNGLDGDSCRLDETAPHPVTMGETCARIECQVNGVWTHLGPCLEGPPGTPGQPGQNGTPGQNGMPGEPGRDSNCGFRTTVTASVTVGMAGRIATVTRYSLVCTNGTTTSTVVFNACVDFGRGDFVCGFPGTPGTICNENLMCFVGGCDTAGDEPYCPPLPAPDAGVVVIDAGQPADAGFTVPDAGFVIDAGFTVDAGQPVDAGTAATDAGVIPTPVTIVVDFRALTIREGTGVMIGVSLSARPMADTIITVSSSDPGAASATPTMLTFTPTNWNTPQAVVVLGVEDADTMDEMLTLTLTGAGSQIVSVSVNDNDVQGLVVSPAVVTLQEGGSDTVMVSISAQPTSSITIMVTSADPGAVSATPAMLTFTSVNWNTPQAVTVLGVEDTDRNDEIVTVSFASAGLASRQVQVRVTDVDLNDCSFTTGSGGVFTGGRTVPYLYGHHNPGQTGQVLEFISSVRTSTPTQHFTEVSDTTYFRHPDWEFWTSQTQEYRENWCSTNVQCINRCGLMGPVPGLNLPSQGQACNCPAGTVFANPVPTPFPIASRPQ